MKKHISLFLLLLFISCNNKNTYNSPKIDFNDSLQTKKWIKKHDNNNFIKYDFIITNNDDVIIVDNINTEIKDFKSKDEIIKNLWCELLVSDSIVRHLVKQLESCKNKQNIINRHTMYTIDSY